MASRWLAAQYNRPGFDLFDFNVYALCSDGDLMEGVGGEAASLAGHLKLSNLCWIYDDNHITIEGRTSLAFSEDVATRFAGYGWNVLGERREPDVHDLEARRTSRTSAFAAFPSEVRRRPADVDHRSQRDRIRRAEQGRQPRGPRGAAGRGGSPPDEGRLRLAGEREVPGARRGGGPFPPGRRRAGRKAARRMGRECSPIQGPISRTGRPTRTDRPPRTARRLAGRHPAVSRRPKGHRQPRFVGQGAQPGRQAHPLAAGRLGRSGPLEQFPA